MLSTITSIIASTTYITYIFKKHDIYFKATTIYSGTKSNRYVTLSDFWYCYECRFEIFLLKHDQECDKYINCANCNKEFVFPENTSIKLVIIPSILL